MTSGNTRDEATFDMIGHIQRTYRAISSDTIREGILETLYTEDAEFIDPFHRMQGRNRLESYFSRLYRNVRSIDFEYGQAVADGNHIFMEWCMTVKHPKLAGGQAIQVHGTSRFEVQGRQVRVHRDYFDGGELLYERLPALGRIIRLIKDRMGQQENA